MERERIKLLKQSYEKSRELFSDFKRAEGALKDIFPDMPKVANTLFSALKIGTIKELSSGSTNLPIEVLLPNITNRLIEEYGIAREDAIQAVGVWAIVLDKATAEQIEKVSERFVQSSSYKVTGSPSETGSSVTGENDVRECPLCSEYISKKAKICKHCKSSVEMINCPYCDEEILSSSSKCGECGKHLKEDKNNGLQPEATSLFTDGLSKEERFKKACENVWEDGIVTPEEANYLFNIARQLNLSEKDSKKIFEDVKKEFYTKRKVKEKKIKKEESQESIKKNEQEKSNNKQVTKEENEIDDATKGSPGKLTVLVFLGLIVLGVSYIVVNIIKERDKIEACEQAKLAASETLWQKYIDKYPDEECAVEGIDFIACAKAKSEDSLEGWFYYVNNYHGRCIDKARKRIQEIEDKKDCDVAKELNKIDIWKTYLLRNPNGVCSKEARERIKIMKEKEKQKAKPRASVSAAGRAVIMGALDRPVIDAYIRRNLSKIRWCYEKELAKTPKLFGRIVVNFTISGTGTVSQSKVNRTTMGNKTVESCVVNQIRTIRFPAPKGGGIVIVNYPFVFKTD
jgi:hypothetical protein